MLGLGFLTPAILLLSPLALGVLLYAYRRGGRAQPIVVSSIFLLRKLARQVPAPRKIRPPLRMLFDLLVVLLIIAAAAGAFLPNQDSEVVILLDNSLSMSARVSPAVSLQGQTTSTVFERAKEEARKALDDLPFGAEVALWVTSPSLRLVTSGFVSLSLVSEQISKAEWVFGKDHLESAVEQVISQAQPSRLIVVSDKRVRIKDSSEPAINVESRQVVAESERNLSIANIRVVSSSGAVSRQAAASEVEVEIENFGGSGDPSTAKATLSLERFDIKKRTFSPLSSEEIVIPKQEAKRVRVKIPAEIEAFRATVRTGAGSASGTSDVIAQDNVAFVVVTNSGSKLAVVSDLSIKDLGIVRLPSFAFESMSPEQYEARGLSPDVQAVLFHRYVPRVLPDVAALVIAPPSDNALLPVARVAQDVRVADWRVGHPLTRYITFSALSLPQQQVLRVPGWGTEVFRTTAGTALYSGEFQGRRVAVCGFELFPYQASRSPLLSVMFLNLLQWLMENGIGVGFGAPYTSILVEPSTSATEIFGVTGNPESLAVNSAKEGRFVVSPQPGVVLSSDDKGVRVSSAVNFFDRDESALRQGEVIEISLMNAFAEPRKRGLSLVEWASRIALFLLFCEFLIQLLRRVFRSRRDQGLRKQSYAS